MMTEDVRILYLWMMTASRGERLSEWKERLEVQARDWSNWRTLRSISWPQFGNILRLRQTRLVILKERNCDIYWVITDQRDITTVFLFWGSLLNVLHQPWHQRCLDLEVTVFFKIISINLLTLYQSRYEDLKSRYWGNCEYSGHRTPWKRRGGGREEYLGGEHGSTI